MCHIKLILSQYYRCFRTQTCQGIKDIDLLEHARLHNVMGCIFSSDKMIGHLESDVQSSLHCIRSCLCSRTTTKSNTCPECQNLRSVLSKRNERESKSQSAGTNKYSPTKITEMSLAVKEQITTQSNKIHQISRKIKHLQSECKHWSFSQMAELSPLLFLHS